MRSMIPKSVKSSYNEFHDVHFNPHSKEWFIRGLPPNSKILDVGCGNNSPASTKRLQPTSFYVGLDVMDYNQNSPNIADEYLIVDPLNFSKAISEAASKVGKFDAVISSHNLEHCDDRYQVLLEMCRSLEEGGKIYLAFPTAKSIRFPSREGSLNYFDDDTHVDTPPDFDKILEVLSTEGFQVDFKAKRYRPPMAFVYGLSQELFSIVARKKFSGTWALYGFESVIWATKTSG